MIFFCFNDCLPNASNIELLSLCLSNSIKEYVKLKNKFTNEIDGIISYSKPNKIQLNPAITLEDCINKLDKPIKSLAYRYFSKYPIENFLEIIDYELLINIESIAIFNGSQYNGFCTRIVYDNNGILFSLALDETLKKNTLSLVLDGNEIFLENLYGDPENTNFIDSFITNKIKNSLTGIDKLIAILGKPWMSDKFKKQFLNSSNAIQNAVIDKIIIVIKRNKSPKLSADGDTIKDVTPNHESEIKILELRIFSPIAYRMYFYEQDNHIYLASLEKKPNPKVQTLHISNALSIIKQQILLQNI